MLNRFLLIIILTCSITVLLTSSCSREVTHDKLPSEIDGEYDIAYSYQGDRKALVKVLNSVRLLNSTAYYESHAFSQEEALIEADIVDDIPFEKSSEQFVFQDFAVGTATIIYFRATRLAVLTCAHVIDFPDTLISYYDVTNVGDQRFIENISIKKKHTNNLTDLRYGDELKVLAIDRDLDLAILGKRFKSSQTRTVPVFNVPLGTAKELTWGNIVFVLGFPGGKKMVTTGIVSSPNRTGEHHFLLDALFNRGLSGGIVLAIRDGIPNFELVGVVNSVAAESEIVLAPHRLAGQNAVDTNIPYTGNIYVKSRKKINYGISFGISIESVLSFFEENRESLKSQGYDVDLFFE